MKKHNMVSDLSSLSWSFLFFGIPKWFVSRIRMHRKRQHYLLFIYLVGIVFFWSEKLFLLAEEVFAPIFNGLSSILDCVDGVTPLAFAAAFAFFLWRTDSFFVALDFAGSLAGSSG